MSRQTERTCGYCQTERHELCDRRNGRQCDCRHDITRLVLLEQRGVVFARLIVYARTRNEVSSATLRRVQEEMHRAPEMGQFDVLEYDIEIFNHWIAERKEHGR